MGETALVTGGGGFIGSSLARELLNRGWRVRVLDDFSTGRRDNLADLLERVDLHVGDLCDPATAAAAVQGCQVVFHQGALPSVPRSVEQPLASHRVNADGTITMLEAARRAGVRRFVYAGSSSAYGRHGLPMRESLAPDPRSPYAASKLAGEYACLAYHACYGLETVVLRYFNVFGPRQDPHNPYAAVIAAFVDAYLAQRAPRVFGDGTQSRDFCYIDNAVEANLLAAAAPRAPGGTYNVACGEQTTLLQILDELAEIFGRRLAPEFGPPRPGDVPHTRADISRAREDLGYLPRVHFPEGLRRTVEWCRGSAPGAGPKP